VALEAGQARAHLEPLILHELSYALPRYLRQMTRQDVAAFLLMILSWAGVVGDKGVMADGVRRWHDMPGLSFADAYLAALAAHRGCPVYTKNVRELARQGAVVPNPLPGA
jgi:predicted nucleic acid-binding protein